MRSPKLQSYAEALILLGLAVACYILFFHRLGDMGLIGPDEPRYAAVAREMYLTGDYITPRLQGTPWLEKPPLMYWGATLAYALFGVSEWSARFPAAISATITVFAVYAIARRLWTRTVALFATLAMASSVGFFTFARAASTDMPLTACLTLGLGFFLIGYTSTGPSRRWWMYGFFAMLGIGSLAKGPVAFALPALALIPFLAAGQRWRQWRSLHPEGLIVGLAIALPWYIACTWANGYEFIDVFFVNHNFQRLVSNVHGHERPIYFYLPVFLLVTFPWTFLLIPVFSRRWNVEEKLLTWWWIAPLVLFSMAGSKLTGYILPVVPAVALMCAQELWRPSSRTFKIAAFFEAGTMAFIGVAFGFFGNTLNVDPHVDGMLIVGVTAILAVMLVITAIWLNPSFLVGINLLAMVLLVLAATNLVLPRFDRAETMRPWEHALDGILPEKEPLCLYKPDRWMEYGMLYYRANGTSTINAIDGLSQWVSNGGRICITVDRSIDEVSHLPDVDIEIVQTIGNQIAFLAKPIH